MCSVTAVFVEVRVRYIFANLFFKSKRKHLRNLEKCFLFHFRSSFCFLEKQILEFYFLNIQISRKQEIHFTE